MRHSDVQGDEGDDLHLNARVAAALREAAALYETQDGGFKADAYRKGARTVSELSESVETLLEREGTAGLIALPGIGRGIARAIQEMVTLGSWGLLERLRGHHDPLDELMRVPGIGPKLAQQIHDELGVESLEELEQAAHDGRLAGMKGVGPRRVQAIGAILASVLGRRRAEEDTHAHRVARPSVGELLDVDREYHHRVAEGSLPLIAPKRFNPSGAAWLPILHTTRGPWHYTALYSNTARAHELGRTRDWVVIYFYDEHDGHEQQCTVVTEHRGEMKDERVVRGREHDCLEHYRQARAATTR